MNAKKWLRWFAILIIVLASVSPVQAQPPVHLTPSISDSIILTHAAQTHQQVAAPNAAWVTILNETFEGDFPGPWTVSETGLGEYFWGKRSCRAFEGSYSGWAVGSGANGSGLSCGSLFPNNANSRMQYGPFSLADATAAVLSFKLWLYTTDVDDTISWSVSTNGTNWYGTGNYGDSGGWVDRSLDLANVPNLGSVIGQPQVWIAFQFKSDSAINAAEGAYLDNIALQKLTAATPPGAFNKLAPDDGATGLPTSLTLSWEASSGADSYEYCYDITTACTGWTGTGTNTSVDLIGPLSTGTTFYWQVRANNASGTTYANGSATDYRSFTTLVNPPGAFNKLAPGNGATGVSTSPTLSWEASSDATGYEYCYDTSNDNACSNWTGTGTTTSAGLSGLSVGTTYYWQVRANNADGTTYANGSATAYGSFTTLLNPPGAFNKLAPDDGATGLPTSLTLSWEASSGADSYEYCYDMSNDNACTGWTGTGTNTSVNLIGPLTIATTYYWQVRANNASGTTYANGSATNYRSFTTLVNPPGAFNKLTPGNGANAVSTSPTLSWEASSDAVDYEYCYDTSNDSACSSWTSAGTNTSAGLSGLSTTTTYYWQVRANNAGGTTYANGSATAFGSFTTIVSPPGAFNKLAPGNGASGVSTSPTLSWGSSSGADGYEYCYDTSNDSACSSWISASTNTSAGLSGLSTATTYYWQVRANNAGGTTYANGSATTFGSFTTLVSPPGAFNKTTPANGASGVSTSPTLSWGSSSGADGYEYCYDTSNDNACSSWISASTNTSAGLSGLNTATTYYWQVRANNAGGTTYANGSATAFGSFTIIVSPPGAFNKLAPGNGASGVSTSPTLSWGTSSIAAGYEYCYDTSNDNTCSNWTSAAANASVVLNNLAYSTTYYWHVRAVNNSGTTYSNGASTAFWSFTTEAYTLCATVTEIPRAECDALLALYNSTGGPGWPGSPANGWNQNNTPCSWYDVFCSNGHVYYLRLFNRGLVGTIPAALGNLSALQTLSLDRNSLSGTIPPELGNLTALTSLNLSQNQLSGSIPASFGNLVDLQTLFLENNQLSGQIPATLGNLTNLQSLNLAVNTLSGPIPPQLGNLTSLTNLSLSLNNLTGIPLELGKLTALTHLTLDGNHLGGNIPPEVGNLVNLLNLDLHNNQLSGSIPPELGNLIKLQHFLLQNNQLSGEIPATMGNLKQLQELNLSDNALSGAIPPQLGNLASLWYFFLARNHLTGSIPPELGNITPLLYLDLESNQLSGQIPGVLGNLTSLLGLYLQDNSFSGPLPPQFGNLGYLQDCDLSQNQLTGSIPVEIANLSNLSSLKIRNNGLYTGNATLLAFLDLHAGGWQYTQTVPPVVMGVTYTSIATVKITWTPILYTRDGGTYRVYYSLTPGGPYTYLAETADKTSSNITIHGLQPDTIYYFMVRTDTPAHPYNPKNEILSDYSNEVNIKTPTYQQRYMPILLR